MQAPAETLSSSSGARHEGDMDILREASRRREAASAPRTFVGRRQEGGIAAPLLAALDGLVELDEPALANILDAALERLLSDEGKEAGKPQADYMTAAKEDQRLVSGMYLLTREAARQRVPREVTRRDLVLLGFSEGFAETFAKRLHAAHARIETRALSNRPGHTHLQDLEWHVRRSKASGEPQIMLAFRTASGEAQHFSTSVEAFQELRYATAKALEQLYDLEGHPMMRIMASIDADERVAM
ncbi:COMM domain-containing protein 5 [Hondaea fermentalgiana]|uniref:COMM domain-containing protein 5 n=1 Tax=Hondaea fermentalgiana TaxID=2315210 RepID=A0A2R5GWA1_9STRA|nr:COMM domain-containing protein 5 [Hondaea fermentalgiana]|eukprot:GBG34855.1 COMM domain-containing protein 5 [Hondaea fermentalgiana]